MNIGQSIKDLRKSAGINQLELAEMVGITQTYLSQIENGKKDPSTFVLQSISLNLEIPLPILYFSSMDLADIAPHKRHAFKILKPAIDALIKEFFYIDKTKPFKHGK